MEVGAAVAASVVGAAVVAVASSSVVVAAVVAAAAASDRILQTLARPLTKAPQPRRGVALLYTDRASIDGRGR